MVLGLNGTPAAAPVLGLNGSLGFTLDLGSSLFLFFFFLPFPNRFFTILLLISLVVCLNNGANFGSGLPPEEDGVDSPRLSFISFLLLPVNPEVLLADCLLASALRDSKSSCNSL